MDWLLEWGPREIRALRMVRRDSHQSLGEHLGASEETVRRWEKGGQPPTHKELLRKLDETLAALEPWRREWFDDLHAQTPASTVDASSDCNTGQEDATDRGNFLKVTGLGLVGATFAPLESLERITHHGGRPVDSNLITAHEDLADALADLHYTQRSDILFGQVAHHATKLLKLLDRPLADEDRARLDEITVASHVEAGLLAFNVADRPEARRHFATAWSVADDADEDALRAQTLVVAGVLHSPIEVGGRGGDNRRAVELMRKAVHHARRADLTTRAYAYRWLGLELAAAGDERGFLEAFDAAERLGELPGQRDGKGFLARYYAIAPEQASNRGVGLVRVGRTDEAIDALKPKPDDPARNAMVLADIATARVLQGEPEEACAELGRAFDNALEVGYAMGIQRILGVRAQFPANWAGLPCVQELDERLRLI